jgi:1-acyl-sn-glycerol-3-phosphate acyltransferase
MLEDAFVMWRELLIFKLNTKPGGFLRGKCFASPLDSDRNTACHPNTSRDFLRDKALTQTSILKGERYNVKIVIRSKQPSEYNFMQKISTYSIIIRSLWITIKASCITIYYSFFGQRPQIDAVVHRWASALLRIVRATVQVKNPHGITLTPGRSYILMSNHTSLYDIPIIFEALPGSSIRMIAKKELFRVPLWGHAMKASEFLAIDRKNSAQAIKDFDVVKEKMLSGIVPWVAPEGTRSRDGRLGLFKKGAFMLAIQTGATIIPVGIRGAARILPAKTLDFQMDQTVEVCIGMPIDATEYTVETRAALLQAVRQQIEEMVV